MSEQAAQDYVELPPHGDAAFAALMDALVPDEAGEAPAEAGAAAEAGAPAAADGGAGADGSGDGAAGPAGAGADGAGAAAGTEAPAAGSDGAAAGGAEQPAASSGGSAEGAAGSVDAPVVVTQLGELSVSLETRVTEEYQQAALTEVREEYPKYFEALEQHPRMLLGQEVPAIGRDGTEILRSTEEAREWQDAVKHLLASEIRDRAGTRLEENSSYLETLHSSIELFQNNHDLIPGTKQFDRELADRFADMVKPYELRVEGKLHGYSIPVQPIVDQLRTQVQAQRASAPPAPASAAPATPKAGAKPADPPQAAVPSKAGSSGESSDFSTLFGTIGLPNLQI